MTVILQELKDIINREFLAIPEAMVRKALKGIENRAAKLVQVEGKALEWE